MSLDSLDDDVFMSMNDVGFPVARVLDGIEAAKGAGIRTTKVNMVVKRGVNDESVLDMADHVRSTGHLLRFIEYMDVGTTNGWRLNDVVPAEEIIQRIAARWPLEPMERNYAGEVANRYRYRDGAGEIGVIASVTPHSVGRAPGLGFPSTAGCTRVWFATSGLDLRTLLRSGAPTHEIADEVSAVWRARTDRYSEIRSSKTPSGRRVEMSYIGG